MKSNQLTLSETLRLSRFPLSLQQKVQKVKCFFLSPPRSEDALTSTTRNTKLSDFISSLILHPAMQFPRGAAAVLLRGGGGLLRSPAARGIPRPFAAAAADARGWSTSAATAGSHTLVR